MKFAEGVTYMMPVAFGPQPPHPAGEFSDVRTLMITYRTDPEAIARVLPEPFMPGPEPLLFAYMQRCRGVNFLAGGEYRLFGVNVSATYPSADGPIHGSFALILWENNIEAIIRGREILGIPKLYADVDNPESVAGEWRVAARDNGRDLISMDLVDDKEMTPTELADLQGELSAAAWFGWKRVPRIDGLGIEVNQPTMIGSQNLPTSAWNCHGSLSFGQVTWEESPPHAHIVRGLRDIPLREFVQAYRTEGTVRLTRASHRILA
jgi:acetoacetate decarboxylase